MHTVGKFTGAQRSLSGGLIVTFEIDDDISVLSKLQELKEEEISLDVNKYRHKRSNDANAYLWVLCDKIAKMLMSTKETIYEMKIKEYGIFEDWEIPVGAADSWKELYRCTKPMYYFKTMRQTAEGLQEMPMVCLRCWRGSHEYDTKEMSVLIDGIVQDAKDLGIDTWTPDEIAAALAVWSPR